MGRQDGGPMPTRELLSEIHRAREDVSLEGGRLKISRPKKDEPDGMDAVTRLVYSLVSRVRLTDLLIEVDSWCGFSGRFTHLKTGEPRSPTPLPTKYLAAVP